MRHVHRNENQSILPSHTNNGSEHKQDGSVQVEVALQDGLGAHLRKKEIEGCCLDDHETHQRVKSMKVNKNQHTG
jgi:hypothetical protein